MINFSPSYEMNYGTGYGYGMGGAVTGINQNGENDQTGRLPKVPGQEKEQDGKLKGLGQEKTEGNKINGLGEEENPNKECQTCKNRKYKDGSDEMVSFKTPTHISPQGAAAAVRSHEQEHVNNAYAKAATNNGKVISASVSIHTAICPECGRTYISGGTTHTQIKYYNEDNPYQKDLKSADRVKYSGMNLDYAV